MKKIIISALLTISIAACGGPKTADVINGGQGVQPSKAVTAKAVLEKIAAARFREGQIIVKFKDGVSDADMNVAHQLSGGTVLRKLSGIDSLYLVRLPAGLSVPDAIGIYMSGASVDYAEPDYINSVLRMPNDLYYNPQQWALQNTGTYANGTPGADIKAQGAWDVTTGSRSVAVAVMDTGIDYTHPDLAGNMWADRVKVLLQDTHWLGTATFKIVGEQVIYTDPYRIQKTDVADIILISHDHSDHCSPSDVVKVLGPNTVIVTTPDCAKRLSDNVPLLKPHAVPNIRTVRHWDTLDVGGIHIEAVPAYSTNKPNHPSSAGWVGFIFTVNRNRDINTPTGGTNPVVDLKLEPGPKIYFAGDTGLVPEMMNPPLTGVDVALLPVSGGDVMTADEAALAALHIRPKVAVPMNYTAANKTEARRFADILEGRTEAALLVDQSAGLTASTIEYDNNKRIDDWRGWNFVDGTNDPWDDNGHGTHVAGIIGATGDNGEGTAGVNWRVELMPLKVCDSSGSCSSSDVIDAIGYATFKGVKIINASLGGPGMSYAMRDAILAARQAGVLVIASAGNGSSDIPGDFRGDNNDINPVYPASFVLDNVIAVASSNQNDRRSTFSNFGLETVHVSAPGDYIMSTVPTTSTDVAFPTDWSATWCTGTPLAGYNVCSGTSMAAPHVAGLAALLKSAYPNYSYSQIRGMIIKYVDKQPSLEGWIYSGGRINAQKAVTSLLPPAGLTAVSSVSSELNLSWSDNSGEDLYVIERKQPDGTFLMIAEAGQNATSFTDRGLAAGTSYTYRIKAVSALPNPPNRSPVMAESGYSGVTGVTAGPQAGLGGGGGGCSVGPRQNLPTAVSDGAVLLLPLVVIGLIRTLRRRK
ncbi:MAG: S8 family serine peptidase [Nitrospirae bacterium]|nr:S8 family serine peptidase [Nitrospirota bacterium]